MAALMTAAPVLPMKVVLTFIPVGLGLPDHGTNVLLGLDNGCTQEGWLDVHEDTGEPVWRDVTAWPLPAGRVVSWALLPEGLNDEARQRQLLLAAVLPGQGALR